MFGGQWRQRSKVHTNSPGGRGSQQRPAHSSPSQARPFSPIILHAVPLLTLEGQGGWLGKESDGRITTRLGETQKADCVPFP